MVRKGVQIDVDRLANVRDVPAYLGYNYGTDRRLAKIAHRGAGKARK